MDYRILKHHLSVSDKKYYEDLNPGWTIKTDNCLQVINTQDSSSTVYLIFEGPYTKPYMCRDCGNYFEVSLGSTLQKIYHNEITL